MPTMSSSFLKPSVTPSTRVGGETARQAVELAHPGSALSVLATSAPSSCVKTMPGGMYFFG